MVAQVRGEDLARELVDLIGVGRGNVRVTELLADDGGVFTLGERIVIGLAGSGLGELDVEFAEEPRDPVVDVLRAIVGVEAADDQRKAVDEGFEMGNQEVLADLCDAEDALPLRDLVDGVDMVKALDPIKIALMHAVDAQVVQVSIGDPGKLYEALVAEHLQGPFAELAGCRA